MARISAAFRYFWKSIAWIGGASSTADKMKKVAEIGMFLFAPGLAAMLAHKVAEWRVFVPWLLSVGAAYLLWKFAIAWDRTAGPIIWIGRPEPDVKNDIFDLHVENRGCGQVTARIYMQNLRDLDGARIPRIDDQVELYWRGYHSDTKMKLFGKKYGIAAMLKIDRSDPESPVPHIMMPGKKPKTLVTPLISADMPTLDKQKGVTFSIRVDFHDASSGEFLKSEVRSYSMRPDTQSPMRYRIRNQRR
jgi:hypothetical protein